MEFISTTLTRHWQSILKRLYIIEDSNKQIIYCSFKI